MLLWSQNPALTDIFNNTSFSRVHTIAVTSQF